MKRIQLTRLDIWPLLLLGALSTARAQIGPGSALQFDWVASQVQVASNPSLTLTSNFTFEAWINPQSPSCNTVLSRGDGATAATDYIFDVGWNGVSCGAQMKVGLFAGSWHYSASTVPLNTWTHIAASYDGTNVSFFINGALDATSPQTGSVYQSGSPLYIGRQGASCNCNFFQGGTDEVRIWNVALAQGQIQASMNRTLTGTEAGLVAYYRFEEGIGTVAHNSAATGSLNDGTLVNGPVWTNSGALFVPDLLPGPTTTLFPNGTGTPTIHATVNPGNLSTTVLFKWGATASYGRQSTLVLPATNAPLSVSSQLNPSFPTTHYKIIVDNSAGSTATPDLLAAGGSWAPLAQPAPGPASLPLLLSDGTVMAKRGSAQGGDFSTTWYRLSPDIHGSYVNGTWSSIAPANYTREGFASTVLRDGRVFVAGGEFGNGSCTAEIYNPVSNSWSIVPIPTGIIITNSGNGNSQNTAGFVDSGSILLSNGKVLIAPVFPATNGNMAIYDPVADSWSVAALVHGYVEDEASWVKLPDGSILVADSDWPTSIPSTNSERYIPSMNQWIADSNLPVSLYDPYLFEMGPGFLLPNGTAFFIGSATTTAIYSPSGTTNVGAWTQGPNIPNGLGAADAPGAMMVNGKILCALSPTPGPSGGPTTPEHFYEYDYAFNAFTEVNGPSGATPLNSATFLDAMLDLPDGSVLMSSHDPQLYIYRPAGPPLATGKPTISGISLNADGSYHLTGTLFNGISQGAAYGDDAQMDSNYPLVRLTNSLGQVYYCRTFNWSSTGVMTGNNPVSTEFTLPPGLPPGPYGLVVVANGNPSDAVPFDSTVHNTADNGIGSLRGTLAYVSAGAMVKFDPSLSGQTVLLTNGELLLSKNLTIDASALPGGIQFNGNHASRIFEIAGGTTVTLNSLTLTNGYPGSATSGGAILNSGTLTLSNCTLVGNAVDSSSVGGAILNYGPLLLTGCTVSGNSADFAGALNNSSTCILQNCTFYGNIAFGGNGGAVDNVGGTLSLVHCSFSGNSALGAGGAIDNYLSQLNVTNSILAGNSSGGGGLDIFNWSSSTVSLGGSNIVQSLANGGGTVNGATSIISANPLLGPLTNNGGPTQTMLPQANSPSVNAAIPTTLTSDQRGFPRPVGPAPDIGAVEFQDAPPLVTTTADSGMGSLRYAGTYCPIGSTITFAGNLSGQSVVLSSGELLLNKNLTVDASTLSGGIRIDAANAGRIFEIGSGSVVTLNSLELVNGFDASGTGGGILNNGTLTLNRCTLSGNSAFGPAPIDGYGGGAIYNQGTATLTLNQCTLTGNAAAANLSRGGGIFNYGTLTVNQSTLSSNSAAFAGGAIVNMGTFFVTLNQSTVAANTSQYGGGIDNYSGTLTINQSTIANNSATIVGGGVYNYIPPATVLVENSIVAANSDGSGLDIYNQYLVTFADSNIVLSASGGSFNGSAISAAPVLAPLGNYGGLTQAMPPLPGSPAIDAAVSIGLTFDQRGFPRPLGLAPDIGAVEGIYNAAGPGRLTGASRLGDGSFHFAFTNFTDSSFAVLATTNLVLPVSLWSNVGPALESPVGSGHFQFSDPMATNGLQRYYRVRSP
jgi:hypothetical protein